ncbi:MAG: xanthine dehydrogenase family protein molybdopterin-binding subunit [Nitrospirae bacterium]|nr:xanthine dehydrogenase family protein molybdopterin-binding subunit [Nitrospirota bacterium]
MTSRLMTRRKFLKIAGLTIAVLITPSGYKLLSAKEMEKKTSEAFVPNIWLQIMTSDEINIFVNKSEMGQGVYTSLPMIIAEELDADWKQIRLKVAPASDEYKDPVWGSQATGGSTSIRHMTEPLRKAGAAAREMLIKAASEILGVPQSECETHMGEVVHTKSSKRIKYSGLVQKASLLAVPQNPSLKREETFKLIGTSLPRIDIPDKVQGAAVFGMDVFIPDMLYAVMARPYAYGSKITSFDEQAALHIEGVTHVINFNDKIAVCADKPDLAWKGKAVLRVKWSNGTSPNLDNGLLEKQFLKSLDNHGIKAREEGEVSTALSHAWKKIESTYLLPYLSHATMEPMNCTAHVRKDRCEIWVPTQNQTGALQVVKKETGLRPDKIKINTTYLGGGFGRRFETDVVEEAVKISKVVGRPVKLIWTREEDMQNDFYRPANCSRISGGIDKAGNLTAWSHKIVCPSIFARIFPGMVKDGIDPAAVEGLKNMEYEIPNIFVEYVRVDTPVPVGFWRSVGSSHNAFTVESFIDELADLAQRDPLEFRLSLLNKNQRAKKVLEVAAEKAGWSKPLSKGEGRGIAQHLSFDSYVAQVAEVSVNKDKSIKVSRVICAVDCGRIINPAIITAQMESGIIMGLSAALKESVAFSKGGVQTSNFHDYDLMRISEVPDIEVHILKSNEKSGGIGEPGLPPIAPAVANAVFKATGARLRNLPMTL